MKKNGFISTTLIYTFFIIFLLLMLFLLNSYSRVRYLLGEIKYDIKNNFSEITMADINLNIFIWNSRSGDFELTKDVPVSGYLFEQTYSYCRNGGKVDGAQVSFENGDVVISSKGRDFCYAYFSEAARDINLKVYTKEDAKSPEVYVNKIPGINYELESTSCDKDNKHISFNESTRKFTITSDGNETCKAVFVKKPTDISLNIYRESASGTYTHNGINYISTTEIPGSNYTFNKEESKCNNDASVDFVNNKFSVTADGPAECDVYFNGSSDNVEIIYMMQTNDGVAGFTTGYKYSRTYEIPNGYRYVGYKCDNSKAEVTYKNGVFSATSDTQTTCRVYFDRTNTNVLMRYHLQKSDGTYESANSASKYGYVYNASLSKCEKGSKITVDGNNLASATASGGDVCDVYFDSVAADIDLTVYVMNRRTQGWEIGNVPTVGYELYNAGCTNNAVAQYENGKLTITAENPTVCELYFR